MGASDGDVAPHADEADGEGAAALDPPGGDEEGAVDAEEFPFRKQFREGFHGHLGDDVLAVVAVDADVVAAGLGILDVGQGNVDGLVAGLDGDFFSADGFAAAEVDFAADGVRRLGVPLEAFQLAVAGVQHTDGDTAEGGDDIQDPEGLLVRVEPGGFLQDFARNAGFIDADEEGDDTADENEGEKQGQQLPAG